VIANVVLVIAKSIVLNRETFFKILLEAPLRLPKYHSYTLFSLPIIRQIILLENHSAAVVYHPCERPFRPAQLHCPRMVLQKFLRSAFTLL
jgi:hypothetical protein